jgi:nicotinate phosphoribosyltransferase
LKPQKEVKMTFQPLEGSRDPPSDTAALGDVEMEISGRWVDTILYEIPILALTSEAYFKFMDVDWRHDGQDGKAFEKGMRLLEAGCVFSEFGTRRRRDYHTQSMVFRGLVDASKEAEKRGFTGKLSGTSNVHLAMRFDIPPVGTVAHEWFMGIAALKGDYKHATEIALAHWVGAFGGKLGIALTDTFGTEEFLKSFSLPVSQVPGGVSIDQFKDSDGSLKSYSQIFTGVRQDSGDPASYVKAVREYYDKEGISDKKTIVFSDSLNIERCMEYKKMTDEAGLTPTFGVGTFLTNDFTHVSTGQKSVPMNIVIKLSSANGRDAIKIRWVGRLLSMQIQ